ncbi:hypothetical protein E2P81_ATG03791 [Venturia nashicola]|nr:hypothetical protein E2P81_ATG03791 [Venturia nashicola]
MSPKKKRSNKRTGVSVSDRPAAQAENEPARSLPPTPSNPVSMPVRRPWADHSDSAVSARPADTPTRSEFGFPYKVEDLELNQFKAQAENEPVRRLGQPNSAIMPVERPLVRLSENLMLAMPVDDNSTRRVFGAAEDPFDTIVYQSNDMEFDTESGTELDEAREDSWKFEATAWSGPIEPATTSPHDSATGIEIPATPGTGTQPLPLPKLNETGSRDPRHSPLHNAETPSPEYVSTFSPENSSHSDHHRIQTEECIDPRNIEENHNPQPNLLLELYTMRMKYLVARNDELERSLARMDELECIDPHPADGRHSPQLNDLSGSHNSKSKCPMCGNEGLECINQPTLEGNHDHHLGRLSDRQTARSKHLITRNEEPGRLSYKQRKKLNTLLCVIYKFPIMLLLLVAAMVNVHEPLPNGLGESGVSSSSTSSSILLPAYLSYPLGRTRGLQAMLTSGGRPRLRQPDCDPQFEITTDNPACHEDNCLGLNIQKRCMQMVSLFTESKIRLSNLLTKFPNNRTISGMDVRAGSKPLGLASHVLLCHHGQNGD